LKGAILISPTSRLPPPSPLDIRVILLERLHLRLPLLEEAAIPFATAEAAAVVVM